MKIQIEFSTSHEKSIHSISRVPCIGEKLVLGGKYYDVVLVMHLLDVCSEVAIVRVA